MYRVVFRLALKSVFGLTLGKLFLIYF